MEDKGYGVLLGGFGGQSLPVPVGQPGRSSASTRTRPDIDPTASARQLRAIPPQPAVLQQLGLLANSLGAASARRFAKKDPDKFRDLYSRSPRLRSADEGRRIKLSAGAWREPSRGRWTPISDKRSGSRLLDQSGPAMPATARCARYNADGLASHHEGQPDRRAPGQKVFRRLHRDWIVLRDELGRVADGCELLRRPGRRALQGTA